MRIHKFVAPSLAAISFIASHANAADILWMQNNDGIEPAWKTLLEANGHTLTAFTGSRNLPTQEDKDYVNSFDLVVMTRSLFNASPSSGGPQIRTEGPLWNTQITTPIIMMQAYLPANHFSSNWGWITTGASGGHPATVSGTEPMTVNDESDPIWTGIGVANGQPTPSAIHTSNTMTIDFPLRPGAVVVASSPVNDRPLIARFPVGMEIGGGILAGERLFFSMNSGNDAQNLTELGVQVLLNAITSLTVGFPPDGPLQLAIKENPDTTGTFDFEWPSKPGKLYDLLTSSDLATPIADWPVHEHGETLFQAIPSAGETTTLTAVPSADPNRFFALREYDAPPPEPLFFFDFEADGGGFTVETKAGTSWAWGKPASTSPGGMVNGGFDSDHCWGTGIGNPGHYANLTITRLRSPVLDLTEVAGAELAFHQALDLPATDSAVVNLISATTDEIIAAAIHTSVDADLNNADWTEVKGISLAAGIGREIRVEWVLDGTGAGTADYMGWYIDTIRIDETTSP